MRKIIAIIVAGIVLLDAKRSSPSRAMTETVCHRGQSTDCGDKVELSRPHGTTTSVLMDTVARGPPGTKQTYQCHREYSKARQIDLLPTPASSAVPSGAATVARGKTLNYMCAKGGWAAPRSRLSGTFNPARLFPAESLPSNWFLLFRMQRVDEHAPVFSPSVMCWQQFEAR